MINRRNREHDNKTYIYVHTFSNTDIVKLPS